ncbi:hypothetical protein PHMEG_0001401 [Phytophthora megakarya]|uniref:Reverse transcriptase RNase H-like domain-containing protein n=1 Tax=Phytophthora megakarya TaxID=4795 RepID=A0A225X1B1_9STRA|nr:hypothetical protein PHMEG_0001401 [Phytophthora megakarya]
MRSRRQPEGLCVILCERSMPIAFKCRKLRIQFREKLAELIKDLLSAKKINHSRSPWASPIVVIIKNNYVMVVCASDWAISGALMQEYDQIKYSVMFARRMLTLNVLNYEISEKEVLPLMRILDLNYNTLIGRHTRVLMRHSILGYLDPMHYKAALLAPWILKIVKCSKGKSEIVATLAASITPRFEVYYALISIAPKMELRRKNRAPIPTVRPEEDLYVTSYDGSSRVKRGGGVYSAIRWKLAE